MGFYTGIYKKKPFYKKWWFWIIIIIVIIHFNLSGDNYTKLKSRIAMNSSPTTSAKAISPDLVVIEDSVRKDEIASYIVGTVKNNSDKLYSHVKIEISLFDASGKQIGSLAEDLNNLEPNGTREFEVMSVEPFSTYKIKNVIGFELPSMLSKLLASMDTSQNIPRDGTTAPDLEMISDSVRNDELASYIVGTVKNNTDKKFLYVQIEFIIYDENGSEIGNALADTGDLGPNGTWDFEAEALGGFSTYKLKNITGFGLPSKLSKLLEKLS